MRLGGTEAILIFLAILLLFGPKKLPELARSMGEAMREFRRGQKEFEDSIEIEPEQEPTVKKVEVDEEKIEEIVDEE